ncbi:MAG TPA: cyclic nucleotide-binding domain-containing protein [Bryobacteraceae bacterium]|jgi:CRP/FNR family cyclic AMP-dependent transcriptional regulator|nr:cyclic nucleotide-binding domain-containing protein [Bryobacteraceae bacterium]
MRKALYFLGILNDADIDWLVSAGIRREIGAGTNLIDEGRPIDSVFLVIDGAFSVHSAALGGRQIAQLMSGEVMGEMSFVDSALPSATVKATERSFVLAIPRRRLNAKLAEDNGFAARFYRALSMFLADRLRNTVASFGNGAAQNRDEGELQGDSMDAIAMAGVRFDWIQQRLRAART